MRGYANRASGGTVRPSRTAAIALVMMMLSTSVFYLLEFSEESTSSCNSDASAPAQVALESDRSPYRIFYGNLHAHTSISDGEQRPDDAFAYARDVGGLDFMAVTDHGEQIYLGEWDEIVNSANHYNEDGVFVAIYGFEFADVLQGHLCVWNSSTNLYNLLLPEFYDWIVLHPEALAGFNHPGQQVGDFNNTAFVDNETAQRIIGIEAFNADTTSYEQYFPEYIKALDNGWQVAPTAGQDNHDANWGSRNAMRTAVLAANLTRGDILDALSKKRFYATNDANIQIHFTGNGNEMGSIVVGSSLTLNLTINDPDNEPIRNATIFSNGGTVVYQESLSGSRPSVNITIEPITEAKYYFARVFEADGDVAFTAPIWIYPTYNFMPVANAGPDQNVTTYTTVTLNGTASFDNEDCPAGDTSGTILSYNWSILSYPSCLAAAPLLANSTTAMPSFTPSKPGSYVAYLKVRDSDGVSSAYDTVTINVENVPPKAEAGANRTVKFLDDVTLDGSASSDLEDCPSGDTYIRLQYDWLVTQDPTGTVALDDPHKQKPRFTAPTIEGDYIFSLRVRDSSGSSSEADYVTITVQWKDLPPRLAQDAPAEIYLTEDIPDDSTSLSDIFIDDSQLYYDCPSNELQANISVEFIEGGKVKLVPSPNWYGTQAICISAHDAANADVPVWWNFTVRVLPANDRPLIISIGGKMPYGGVVSSFDVLCGAWLNITLEVTDVDIAMGENQEITVDCNMSAITVTGNYVKGQEVQKYNLSYHPDRTSEGSHDVSIVVMDSAGASDRVNFTINVVFVNSPPRLEGDSYRPIAFPSNGTTIKEGQSVTLNASKFVDPDGDRLTYTWTSDVEGKTLYSGFVSGIKTGLTKVGKHTITLKVDDGHGGIVTSSIWLNVEKVPSDNGGDDGGNDIIPGLDNEEVGLGGGGGVALAIILLVAAICAALCIGLFLRMRSKPHPLKDFRPREGRGASKEEQDKNEKEEIEKSKDKQEKNGKNEAGDKKPTEEKGEKGEQASSDKQDNKEPKEASQEGKEPAQDAKKLDSKQKELEAGASDTEAKK